MKRKILTITMVSNIILTAISGDILKTGFENKALFSPEARKYRKASDNECVWGYFTDKGPIISKDTAHSGGQAVKLIKGGDYLKGLNNNKMIPVDGQLEFSAWVKRKKESAFTLQLYNSKMHNKAVIMFYIQPGGQVAVSSMKDGKFSWQRLKMNFPAEKWCKLTLTTAGGDPRVFSVAITDKKDKTIAAATDIIPINKKTINAFSFRNAGGNEVFVDDVVLSSSSIHAEKKPAPNLKNTSARKQPAVKAAWPQLWKQKNRRINLKQYMGSIAYWQTKFPQSFKVSMEAKSAIDLPLYCVEITDRAVPNENKSIFLITTLHAGAERNGAHAVLAYMDWLLSNAPDAVKIRKHNIVVFIPIANPDGFFPAETFHNAGKVDIYSGSRGGIYQPDSLDLKAKYQKIAPEIDFYRAVCDKYKPDMQIDIHGLAMHYYGQLQPAMCGSAGSNYALRPWSNKINDLMVKAGNRAGIGYSQTEDMAQRLFWGPTMGRENELLCWYGRPYFYTAMYTSLKYHTMVSTMECTWNDSIIAPLKAVMLHVSAENAADLPVNRIKSNGAMSIEAYGKNRAECRASRCDLWQNVKQFAVGSSYNYTPNWRIFVVAYGKTGLDALTGSSKDSGRWGQILWPDFFKNIATENYINAPEIKKFMTGGPPVYKIMYEKGDNKNPVAAAKLKTGFAMTLWIAQPDVKLVHLKLNGKDVLKENLRQWTENGFTFVEIAVPATQAAKESLWVVTCAWKGPFDAKRADDYGWLPNQQMQKWIDNDFSKNKNFKLYIQAEKGATQFRKRLKR